MEFNFSSPMIIPDVITFPVFPFGDAQPINIGPVIDIVNGSPAGTLPSNIISIGGTIYTTN